MLTLLWRTGEIFLQKPDVGAERRNIMHYLYTVFPEVLPLLDRRLRQAWASLGFDPAVLDEPQRLPGVRLSTWVGGDRDGHPLVTADVTRQTLGDLRLHGLLLIQRQLGDLARQSSLSDRLQTPPPALRQRVRRAGGGPRRARRRDRPQRPGRVMAAARPPDAGPATARKRLSGRRTVAVRPRRYQSADELMADLAAAPRVARRRRRDAPRQTRRLARSSGRCGRSASIWRRSTSVRTAASTTSPSAQLLAAAGVSSTTSRSGAKSRRLDFLNQRAGVAAPVPARRRLRGSRGGRGARLLPRARRAHPPLCGRDGLGALIVSMTRRLRSAGVVSLRSRSRPDWSRRRTGWPACCRWCRSSRRSTICSAAPTFCARSSRTR